MSQSKAIFIIFVCQKIVKKKEIKCISIIFLYCQFFCIFCMFVTKEILHANYGLMRDWQTEPQLRSVYQEQKPECFKVFRALQWRLWWDLWRLREEFCDHETIPGAVSCCLVFFTSTISSCSPWMVRIPPVMSITGVKVNIQKHSQCFSQNTTCQGKSSS